MAKLSNTQFYTASLKKYGQSAQGLNWNSQVSQFIRFEIIEELLPKDLQNYTLLDVGCGFGDLYHHLHVKPKKYTGVDTLSSMVAIAKEHTAQEILELDATKYPLPTADFVTCSGALNILDKFQTTLFLQNCYRSAKKGFIFNVLYGEKKSEQFNYLDKYFIQKLAESLHVKEICYREGYMENDITVGFFR